MTEKRQKHDMAKLEFYYSSVVPKIIVIESVKVHALGYYCVRFVLCIRTHLILYYNIYRYKYASTVIAFSIHLHSSIPVYTFCVKIISIIRYQHIYTTVITSLHKFHMKVHCIYDQLESRKSVKSFWQSCLYYVCTIRENK